MAIFTKVEIFPYAVSDLTAFYETNISARATIDSANVPGRNFKYWTKLIIDGVESDLYTNTISYPSGGVSNNVYGRGFFQPKNKKIKIRLWEADPATNPDAFVESEEIEISNMQVLLNSPKPEISVEFNPVDQKPTKTNMLLYVNNTVDKKYWSLDKVKVYSENPVYTFYEGVIPEANTPIEIDTPENGTIFEFVLAEVTMTDLSDQSKHVVKTLVNYLPRFFYEGEESKITDFRPLMTSKGNRVFKLPFINDPTGNNYFSKRKSAISGVNFDETFKLHTFEDNNRGDASTDYINVRTGENVANAEVYIYQNSSPDIGNSYISFSGNQLNSSSYDINTGDKIQPTMTLHDGTTIQKEQLTAQLCALSNKNPTSLVLKSLPPVYFGDPYYKAELISDTEEFVMFGEVSGNSQNVIKQDNQSIVLSMNVQRYYPNDGFIRIYRPMVWYPNLNTITSYSNPNYGEIQINPIYTTKQEKITLDGNKTPTFGDSLIIESKFERFLSSNSSENTYKWTKNGVVLPDQISSYIEIASLTPDDNGKYVLEYTTKPSGIRADDSALVVTSNEFEINITSSNELTFVTDSSDLNLEVGAEMTITGTITIPTNTISKSVITKNGTIVDTFENGNLTPTYTIPAVSANDAGVYTFVITYTDGGVVRTFTSEPKHVTVGTNTPIDFNVTVTVNPVSSGAQATFVGKVNITNPPAGVTYKYQWHRATTGAIIGETAIDMIIDSAEAGDAGEYWLSVLAEAPDHSATVKASPRVNFVVLRDPLLKFTIASEKPTVADGKPAKLTLGFSASGVVNPTWEWYANGVVIPDSKDKAELEHIGFGDVVYYVIGKAQNPDFEPDVTQSNIIVVKGVIAVENLNLGIEGPTEAGLGERCEFKAVLTEKDHEDGSNPLSPDNYTFEWFRGATKIGTGSDIRVYAAADAGGNYTYKIHSKVDPSITSTSPIHTFTIKDETTVSVTLPQTKSILVGDALEIVPTVNPDDSEAVFQWMKNGQALPGKTNKTLLIVDAQKEDSGVYTLSVTIQSTPTISTPCVVKVSDITPPGPDPIEGPWYIHDLRPAQNNGFTWMGWWVLDEIQKANNDNFDWIKDPTNERFKYQNVLKALADNQTTWEDILIQESRNGYILKLSDLVLVGA